VRAFVIDWIIIALLLVGVLFAAVAADSDRIGRILGFAFVAVWLLYEPVLVSLTGSTVGHYLSNLRVVDDRAIAAYATGCFLVAALVEFGMMRAGVLSAACIARGRCLRSEGLLLNGLGLVLIGFWVICIIQGWRGRLYGCRARPQPAQVNPGTPS
jgi:hypothetical protein